MPSPDKKTEQPKTMATKLKPLAISLVVCLMIILINLLNILKQMIVPFYRLLFARRHPLFLRTPEERFEKAGLHSLGYTFAPKYIKVPLGSGNDRDAPRYAIKNSKEKLAIINDDINLPHNI